MKLHIIRLVIGFTALVASFLPQKAEACTATCRNDAGTITDECTGNFICLGCIADVAVCINWP